MLNALASVWDELVDATVDVVELIARFRTPHMILLTLEEDGVIRTIDGAPLEDQFAAVLGAKCSLSVPSHWFFQTTLDPIPAESRPFLESFARQQIERVTPWREEDVYCHIAHDANVGEQQRLLPVLTVIPKSRISPLLATLGGRRFTGLSISASVKGRPCEIEIGSGSHSDRFIRRKVAIALALFFTLMPGAGGLCWWQAMSAQNEAQALARQVSEARNSLVEANLHATGNDPQSSATKPLAVVLLNELSATVPDSSYVTRLGIDKDHVTLSGIAVDPSALVALLEKSGHFSDVTFSDAITRSEKGEGNRFSLDMRISNGEVAAQ